jgi:hypothetical protein
MRRWLLLCFLPLSLFASKVTLSPVHPSIHNPWLTGPLLAPSDYTVSPGNANYEPYLYVTAITGGYDRDWKVVKSKHVFRSNVFQPEVDVGLTSWLDFEIYPTLNYNYTDHQARWTLGDLPVLINIQLYKPKTALSWIPAVKFSLIESLPIGKYRRLNPKKQGTDFGGSGSFETSFGLTFGKLWHFSNIYFMTTRLYLQYTLPAATHLKGFNYYGGGFGTNARFFPRQVFSVDFAVEINLSEHWALACDVVGLGLGRSHFTGNPGFLAEGVPAPLGAPAGVQYSLAPAIEYNWNANLGVIGGSWFSFAGRNSSRFWSAVLALNYYQ